MKKRNILSVTLIKTNGIIRIISAIMMAFSIIIWPVSTVVAQNKNLDIIVFSARAPRIKPLSPGHAFVSFGSVNDQLETCITTTYGFYPCIGCSVFSDENPGRVVKGYRKNSNNNRHLRRLAIKVDTHLNAQTRLVLEKWQKKQYNVIRRNCVKFICEVAAAQGLSTPKTQRWGIFPKLPKKFIRQLEKRNSDRAIFLPGFDEYGMPPCLDENENGIPDHHEISQTDQ